MPGREAPQLVTDLDDESELIGGFIHPAKDELEHDDDKMAQGVLPVPDYERSPRRGKH